MIKQVRFGDGVKGKQVRVFDTINGENVYILKEEEKFLGVKDYCVNPMVETNGTLGFFAHNYMFYTSKIKNKKEEEYLTFLRE